MVNYNEGLPVPTFEIKPENLQEYRQSFYDINLIFLANAPSIDTFHAKLSEIIFRTPDFSEEQLIKLSRIVSKPWKAKRGRATLEIRRFEILDHYVQLKIDGKIIKRKEILNFIMTKYQMTEETAVKEFNLSFKVKMPERVVVFR